MRIEQSLPASRRTFRVFKNAAGATVMIQRQIDSVTSVRKWDLSKYTGDERDSHYIVVSTKKSHLPE